MDSSMSRTGTDATACPTFTAYITDAAASAFDATPLNLENEDVYGQRLISEADTTSPTQLRSFLSSSSLEFFEHDCVVVPNNDDDAVTTSFDFNLVQSELSDAAVAGSTSAAPAARIVISNNSADGSAFTSPESAFTDLDLEDIHRHCSEWVAMARPQPALSAEDESFMYAVFSAATSSQSLASSTAAPSVLMGADSSREHSMRRPLSQSPRSGDELCRFFHHEALSPDEAVKCMTLGMDSFTSHESEEMQRQRHQPLVPSMQEKHQSVLLSREVTKAPADELLLDATPSVFRSASTVKLTRFERHEAKHLCKVNDIKEKKTLWQFSVSEMEKGGWESCWTHPGHGPAVTKKRSILAVAGQGSVEQRPTKRGRRGDNAVKKGKAAVIGELATNESAAVHDTSFSSAATSASAASGQRQFYEIKNCIQSIPNSSDPTRFQQNGRCLIACEACKRRKMRCTNEYPSCANCTKRGTTCCYAEKVRTRGRAKPMTPSAAEAYSASLIAQT